MDTSLADRYEAYETMRNCPVGTLYGAIFWRNGWPAQSCSERAQLEMKLFYQHAFEA